MWARIGRGWLLVLGMVAASLPSRAEAGQIRGSVVDREGKPAVGAKVWAAKLSVWEPCTVVEATSDGSGSFAIEAGPGTWAVFALRGVEGGRVVAWGSIPTVEEGKDPAPVTVRLGPPTTLKGRLIDAETGRPITGGRFALDDARRLEVDAQGRFEAPGLEPAYHEAYPLCPGFERKRILFDTTGRPDAELELKLPRAGKIVGRVLGEDGKPIPGASVGVKTSGSFFSGAALWEDCSADGRYSYDGRPLGRTGRLSARAPGYLEQEREDVIVPDASTPAEYDFTLRPDPRKDRMGTRVVAPAAKRRVVSGTVVGPDGKPVADAQVRWDLRTDSNGVPETKSDAHGAFRLEAVPDVENVLSVMAKGLAPAFTMIGAGGDREAKVELKAGATIRGRVVDESGSPIEGVKIAPVVANPKPNMLGTVYLDGLRAETDRDGRFTLEGMPEGVTADFVAADRSALRRKALSPADPSKNELVMLGQGAIRGRVVDPFGVPVRNFRVQVGMPRDAKPGDPVGGFFAGYSGFGLTFTRADGVFTITRLTAGNLIRLTAIADGMGVGEVDRVEAVPIGRLKPAEELTIKLGVGHPLRVRVFQKDGKPVEGARVTAIQSEGRGPLFQWGISESSWDDSVTARVDDRGWASFPSLAFGKGTIVVRARGFARTKLDWAKDEEEMNAFLVPEARLKSSLLDQEGKPVAGARIVLRWGQGETMNVRVDDQDGRFEVGELPPGKCTFFVPASVGQCTRASETFELESGKTTTEEIRVDRTKPVDVPVRKR